MLNKQGKLVLINANLPIALRSIFRSFLICGVATENKEALDFLKSFIDLGEFQVVMDKIYPLQEAVKLIGMSVLDERRVMSF